MAAHRKLDRHRDDLYAGGLRKKPFVDRGRIIMSASIVVVMMTVVAGVNSMPMIPVGRAGVITRV